MLMMAMACVLGPEAVVAGDYVEARNCDVYTGPCFQNSETGLRGNRAVVCWSVRQGLGLDGLRIVAVLSAEGTLHTDVEGKVKAVVFIEPGVTCQQAKALLEFARSMAPKYLSDVVSVQRRDIEFSRKGHDISVRVGEDVSLKTTAICPCTDNICCNEVQAYPALSGSAKVECAKTLEHEYSGDKLDCRWSEPDKRSALVGSFSR